MNPLPAAQRLPDGSLVLPAETARFLEDTLQRFATEFEALHGREVSATAQPESTAQTAQRQDFVDQLSASVGVVAPRVSTGDLALPPQVSDQAHTMILLQALRALLFPGQGPR